MLRTETKERSVHDLIFIALSTLFFAISLGYVAGCDRLMK